MKRICCAILALFYLCSTAGVTLYQHYCMGELESVSVFHGNDRECGTCGMQKHTAVSNGCCKDVTFTSEKCDNFHISSADLNTLNIADFVLPLLFNITIAHTSTQLSPDALLTAHAPPPLQPHLFIQYHNFRI